MKHNERFKTMSLVYYPKNAALSLAGILLLLIFLFMVIPVEGLVCCRRAPVYLEYTNNGVFIEAKNQHISVEIRKNGIVYVGYDDIKDFSWFRDALEKEAEMKKTDLDHINLYIDGNVEYGKVVTVLDELRKAGVRHCYLITDKYSTTLEYIAVENTKAAQKKLDQKSLD